MFKKILFHLRYLKVRSFFRTGNITGIFGLPRAGKTTFSAMICFLNSLILSTRDSIKNRILRKIYCFIFPCFDQVYCTDVTIQNCIHIDYESIGKWSIPYNSLLILEECGLGFDNRNWKSLPRETKRIIALIGHRKSSILWSSQTADVDKSLRVRSHRLYMLMKSRRRGMSYLSAIDYQFGVDNDSGELRDIYSRQKGLRALPLILTGTNFWFKRPPYYRYFDSYVDDYKYPMQTPENKKEG